MATKVSIISWHNVGATFLDWSLYWLTGANKLYNEHLGWVDVVSNPIDSQQGRVNAHAHEKNYPRGNAELLAINKKFDQISTDGLLTAYTHVMPVHEAVASMTVVTDRSEVFKQATEIQCRDLLDCQLSCYQHNINVVVLDLNLPIYYMIPRFLGPQLLTANETYNSINDHIDDYFSTFFNESLQLWKEKDDLTSTWSRREFYALTARPYAPVHFGKYLDYTKPTTYIDARELFFDGEMTMTNLINSLGLTVNKERLKSWIPVYMEWQRPLAATLRFIWNLDRICECIVNNYYYDLSTYNLQFWHESIIQHIIIYRYGLNFKSWNLEKFPNNTQDLHKLLEPNIHDIDIEYAKTLQGK